MKDRKLVVILGPTASGKTDLSVKLAKKFNGEIISADSRQVYKGLNIGSGKITKSQMRGVPHHLLDVANPKKRFSVAQYQKLAFVAVKNIHAHNKIPFLVGGTGFYIQSIVDGIVIPKVKPNWKLRKKLEKMGIKELFLMLNKLDPVRAKNIDPKNPRRLIRAIEIVIATGKPVPPISSGPTSGSSRGWTAGNLQILQIGMKKSPEELKRLIHKRLQKRKKAIITEVKRLHKNGLSWERLEELGLEYRYVAQYLQGDLSREEMIKKLQKEIEHFSKRQMTWFKRDKRIR